MRYRLIVLLVALINVSTLAQETPLFTHYYANPYIYNPAYAGLEGRSTVSLTHRRQWLGIQNAPVTSNFTFHSSVMAGFNMGLNVTQDNFGIFQNSGALLTFGYQILLGHNHYLSFGISGGAKFQNIDFTGVNVSDPALVDLLDQNKSIKLDGNAGIAYHVGGLNLGFSLQNIFRTDMYPLEDFEPGDLDLIRNYMITGDYMFYFGNDEYIFQPFGSYRVNDVTEPQWEAGAIFHIKHALWIGGSYRDDFGLIKNLNEEQGFGIIGLIGFKKEGVFSLGYAYEMPMGNTTGINMTSHEIHVNFAFGEKKDRAKKYPTFLASRKPKKPEKKKKKEKEVKEDTVKTEPVEVKEDTTKVVEDTIPVIEEKPDTVTRDTTQQVVTKPVDVIETTPPDTTQTTIPKELQPAVVVSKGGHPFELDAGHFVIVGAFGQFNNAVNLNDRLVSQGYTSGFGFSSEKKLFYVYISAEGSAEDARKKRDEIRKVPAYKDAWYLLVNE
ncbi:MAG: PorP/SprF family type IX secretion system membrane protein [Bacteroidota bacterium]